MPPGYKAHFAGECFTISPQHEGSRKMSQISPLFTFIVFLSGLLHSTWVLGAPKVADALKLTPLQKDIEYDKPSAAEVEKCTIKNEKIGGVSAWVIRNTSGQVLRNFADSNGDNVVDTWSYYRNGLVIYRDIDSNFNGKADQYRWFHSAGSRWGLNLDEDDTGTIDRWKMISAEEVAEEVVVALCKKDAERFSRLLLTGRDISSLGLAKDQSGELSVRVQAASGTFRTTSQQFSKESKFTDFGGLRPGLVPAGTHGLNKDLLAYENVWAMVIQDGEPRQLHLGTMVKVGDAWKLIDGPSSNAADRVATGFFFDGGTGAFPVETTVAVGVSTDRTQEILTALEKLDQKIDSASKEQQAALNAKRADLLEQLAGVAPDAQQRDQWLTQLADMVSAAVQDGSYPKGIERLKSLETKLASQDASDEMVAYFQFQRMLAEYYGVTLADAKVDYAKAQAKWLEDLEAFVQAYPKSQHSAEAILQLAMGSDISGDTETATKWYRQIVKDYPNSSTAPKAKGAVGRLTCVGREIRLQGNAIQGGKVDLRKYRGKVVLVQYWNTSSPTCEEDHASLKKLYAKYGSRRFDIVGVNLDYTRDTLLGYLRSNRLPWKQLHEKGGFESRLANEMGVITLPLMLLVDQNGKVVSTTIQIAELEAELKELMAKGKLASKRK